MSQLKTTNICYLTNFCVEWNEDALNWVPSRHRAEVISGLHQGGYACQPTHVAVGQRHLQLCFLGPSVGLLTTHNCFPQNEDFEGVGLEAR